MMHGRGKSDEAVVARKLANQAAQAGRELVERRAEAKGNAGQTNTRQTQSRASVTQGLDRIREAAKAKEKDSLAKFVGEQRGYFRANPQDADKLLKVGLAAQPQVFDHAELAAWATLCRVVLNLQETITRN